MDAMGSREAIHALVDALPEDEIPAAWEALERIQRKVRHEGIAGLSAYDKAKAAGAVGCVEGPEDLATNPEHMADFGR